ncbi:MAG: type II secretion system GspH family protein [Sulfuritalea sp.]|jgi:MSHA pilin protein MshD|nr:type II secretion system GspH family protein [Sulfuritalea sp.]
MSTNRRQRGFTLIELIVFIVIVSVALVGVLTVFNVTTKSSADPMIRKQALAIAEALLEEVMLQPFTVCDPDDATADTGTCTSVTEAMGPDTNPNGTLETRASSTDPFDNVNDYNGLSTTTNVAGGGAALYTATVSVTAADLHTITLASGNALLIRVSVAAPGETIVVEGYRTRHSPNMLP